MGIAVALIFTLTCGGIALACLFFTEARYRHKRGKKPAGTVILYLLAGVCIMFALYMGWMLLDCFRYAGF